MTRNPMRRPLAQAIAYTLLGLALAMPAIAQTQGDSPSDEAEEKASQLDAVTVTGSRIKRAGYDTLEPAISVGKVYIEKRGLTNVADALNEIPGFGIGVTPEGGQSSFGAGVNFVNRFGLGSNRTLTLVNGRRFVSSNPVTIFGPAAPGLQVDLNAIPTQLVERIDNLTVGGAPTYGSDAIAGTVNVILRRDYEGLEVGSTIGATQYGDNQRFNGRVLWGTNFADGRGNFTLAGAVDTSEGVRQSDRNIFTRNLFYGVNPLAGSAAILPGRTPANDGRANPNIPFNTGGADGIPNAVLAFNRRLSPLTPGGLLFPATGATALASGQPRGFGPAGTTWLQFDRNGNIIPYNPGTPFGTLDASGGDGFNLTETGQIISDLDRANLYSTANFQVTDNFSTYFEGLYFQSKGTEIVDQPIYNATVFGGLSAPITFSATDPRLTDQARAVLAANGITSFRLSRASRDLVENNARTETQLYRAVFGGTLDFQVGNYDYAWDTSLTYGRSDADNFQTVLNQQNFVNAMNVTRNAAGQLVCDPNGTLAIPGGGRPVADPNCRPIDLFGEGRTSAEGRNYVTGITEANSLLKQTVINTNVGGTLFEYWAGPVDFNLGYEYRKEEGRFTPNDFQVRGLGRAVPIGPNEGQFSTDEFFAEFRIPLIGSQNEIPLFHSLDIEAKGRRVDNTVNGEFDTWTFGVQWRPIEDLLLRGNQTRSLRAPSITELFTPVSSAFFFVNDPCDGRFISQPATPGGAAGPGSPRFENCQALFRSLGLVGQGQTLTNFQATIVSASQQGVTGGDPNLRNEDAKASTFGFVWEPSFVPGLSVQMDYVEIDIRDAIGSLSGTQIANLCYDDPNFNRNDPLNGNEFCRRLNRTPNGQILAGTGPGGTIIPAVRTGFANFSAVDFRGITGQLNYVYQTDDGWTYDFGATAFNNRELSTLALGVRNFDNDEIGNSTRQYQFSFGVNKDDWTVNLQSNFQSAALFDNNFTVESRDILRVDSYTTWDLGVNYDVAENGVIRFSITNMFDKEPPFGTVGIGVYDILGRRYALSTDWSF